jgi:uncharacterized protein
MKPFSLLVKPASADCNLRCAYCFYLSRSALYPQSARHRMSDEVLERVISNYMATEQPQYVFVWQGGEPTLLGVEFFRRVTELQKKSGKDGSVVANGLQTNAVLLDDEFAAHLAAYNFLVGVSLDGPAELHDRYRINAVGRGSHSDVMRGIECLRRNQVEFNALTLVSAANVRKGKEVYNYIRDLGILHHQYIPCVEFDERGKPMPYAITAGEWGDFLGEMFDEWIGRDSERVSVRLFDSILTLLVDGTYDTCHLGRDCCQYFVVEYNGDIYPCDFFVAGEEKLGNIMSSSWEELAKSPEYLRFGRQKTMWPSKCARCENLRYCSGDCPKHRLFAGDGAVKPSWLCEGWRQFYRHALPRLDALATSIRKQRGLAPPL